MDYKKMYRFIQHHNEISRWSSTLEELSQQHSAISELSLPLDRITQQFDAISHLGPSLSDLAQLHSAISELSLPIDRITQQFNVISQLGPSLSDLAQLHSAISELSLPIDRITQQFNTISHLGPSLSEWAQQQSFISQIESWKSSFAGISSIDFTGIEKLDISSLLGKTSTYQPEMQQDYSDLPASVTVEKSTKLKDITLDEFEKLLKKHTSKGSGKKTLSIAVLITYIFEEYTKEIAIVLLEIVFTFTLTFLTGQLNAEVVAEVGERIEETKTFRDAKKVITRYVKVNPTNQIAFLRKETFLRESHSKTSPVVSESPITTKTVLTIIERKNNWVKVQVDTGNSCGETGWVQESNVIKFKKID